ncbi:Piso0_001716 [Millerozyma farinosa CBS 7064]|uniref:Piso0_001716 protein n=1 Tax=Pichia sorbitophila (strain ATCC MYA-4447 / BCRC 22081 / CBS 7064 / NBRC 10061 / NRRL Y-12695) TaxID=559304 RepID=G8YLJ0_PICSO|nr:Piso0_001716 [Millerozyma farinosa CBS 7064]
MAAEINNETSNLSALGRFVRFLGQKLLGNRDEDDSIVRITDAKSVRQRATQSPGSGASGVRKGREAVGKSAVRGRNRRKRARLDGKYDERGNRSAGPKAGPNQRQSHDERKNKAKVHRVYAGLRAGAGSAGSRGAEKSPETGSRRTGTDDSPKLNGSSHPEARLASETFESPLDRASMVFRAIRVDPNSTSSSYSESGSDAETRQSVKQSSISFILNKAASPIEYYKEDLPPDDSGPHLPSRAPQTPPLSSASREFRSAPGDSRLGQVPVQTPLATHAHSSSPTTRRLSRTPSYRVRKDITLTNLNPSNATPPAAPATPSPRTTSVEPKSETTSSKRPGSRLMSEILAERYQNSGMTFKGGYLSPSQKHHNH